MGNLFSGQQTQYTNPPLPDYLKNYLSSAANFLTGQVGTSGVGPYPGPLTADITPQQGQAINNTSALAQGSLAPAATGLNALNQYVSGAYTSPFTNPYIPGIVNTIASTTDQQLQQALSQINARFGAMNLGTSSPLLNATTNLYGAVIPQEAQNIGNLLNTNLMNNQQIQAGLIPQSISLPAELQTSLLQAGQVPQQTQQNLYNAWYNEYLRLQQQQYAPITAGGGLGLGNLTAAQPTTYNPPAISGLISGLGNLASAGAGKNNPFSGFQVLA